MIKYPQANVHPLRVFQLRGSAFPFAFSVACPCALLAGFLKVLAIADNFQAFEDILQNSAAHSGFTFLCGFLVVFRTSQAYHRMWDGVSSVEGMQVGWFDCASALCAFSRSATADETLVLHFQHQLVRLLSMLHAVALAQLESQEDGRDHSDSSELPKAFLLELIDARGIDRESLMSVQDTDEKVALIYQWLQSLIIDNVKLGVLAVPPPILTRSFQRLSDGLNMFHNAYKITNVPYPFPYMQATEWLLMLHWIVTPMVVCSWTTSPVWTAVFVFIQTFILWALNTTACQLENPFGDDDNDMNAYELQTNFNQRLLLLLRPSSNRIPHLSEKAVFEESKQSLLSFRDVWEEVEQETREGDPKSYNLIHPKSICTARLNAAKQHAVDRLATLIGHSDGERPQAPADNHILAHLEGDRVLARLNHAAQATAHTLHSAEVHASHFLSPLLQRPTEPSLRPSGNGGSANHPDNAAPARPASSPANTGARDVLLAEGKAVSDVSTELILKI